MKATINTRGAQRTKKTFARMAQALNRTLPSLVTQGARSCAINYGYHTQPYGFADAPAEKFRSTVGAQVAQIYATRENPSAVYLLIRNIDPVKAEAYWAAHKKGSKRRALDILRSVSVPNGTDISILKAARTGRKASVPKRAAARSLVTMPQQRALWKQQRALVGFAKAGWYQAARALGRVRRSVEMTDGTRTSEEIFPGYIRKLARQYPGIGHGVTVSTDTHAACTVSSSVRHAADALEEGRKLQAEDSARENFRDACRVALYHITQKRTRSA